MSAVAAACAPRTPPAAGVPVADPTATAAALAAATAPSERKQINFGWTLDEAGSRVRGRGVIRLQPTDRLRLDLFGPRNESYLSAAMVGDEARLPPGATGDVAIPSPALLWAGIGVIRPPRSATLESATVTPEATILRYADVSGDLFEYQVSGGGAPRLEQLQRLGSRGPLETVRIERDEAGEISRSTYRDWSAYRDLTLEIESSENAEPFPEAIWTP